MIRKATIHRFPYVIAFEKHEQHVLVLAVAHASAGHSTGSRARALDRVQNVSKTRVELSGIARTPVDFRAVLTPEDQALVTRSRAPSPT